MELFNPEEIIERQQAMIDALTRSTKTIEGRLDNLKTPPWRFWLPICISVIALIVAIIGPRLQANQTPRASPMALSQPTATPTQSPPSQGSQSK